MAYNGFGTYSSNPYLNPSIRPYQSYTPPMQQSYMQPQMMVQQPIQQQSIQPQQTSQQSMEMPIQDIRFLTADEIKAFIVPSGTTALLIDRTNKLAHLKTADTMGQSSSKVVKYEDYIEEKPKQEEPVQPIIDTSLFVEKKDFESSMDKIAKQLDKLEKQIKINSILKENEGE